MTRWPARALLALAPLALAACAEPATPEPPPRAIEVMTVSPETVATSVSVVGRLEAERQARVAAELPERIEQVHVALGQAVRRGDPLVTLRGDLYAAGVGQATGALEAARAGADLAAAQLERVRVLHAAGTASLADLRAAESQHASAEASVRQVSGARSQAAAQSARSVIRAPFDGVVALLDADVGDIAAPGRPLAVIVEPGPARIALDIPERDFSRVAPGQAVRAWPLVDPSLVVFGAVEGVGGFIDPSTRTGRAEVILPASPILPGSAVKVAIDVDRREGVLVVPAVAVQLAADFEDTREGTVFVVRDQRVSARAVIVGERLGDRLELREGVDPGAVIATLGAHLLRDGDRVLIAGREEG
jgi:RND family efflux transporter MFP subunit